MAKKKVYKIDLGDNDDDVFKALKSKLLDAIFDFFETPIDYSTGSTIKDEAREFTSLTLNFAKEKLKKAGIENHKLIAEIDEKYSMVERNKGEASKSHAEARKLNIEARKLEFDQKVRELSMKLAFAKAMLVGRKDNEAVIFTKEIEAFNEAVHAMKENNRLLE